MLFAFAIHKCFLGVLRSTPLTFAIVKTNPTCTANQKNAGIFTYVLNSASNMPEVFFALNNIDMYEPWQQLCCSEANRYVPIFGRQVDKSSDRLTDFENERQKFPNLGSSRKAIFIKKKCSEHTINAGVALYICRACTRPIFFS